MSKQPIYFGSLERQVESGGAASSSTQHVSTASTSSTMALSDAAREDLLRQREKEGN